MQIYGVPDPKNCMSVPIQSCQSEYITNLFKRSCIVKNVTGAVWIRIQPFFMRIRSITLLLSITPELFAQLQNKNNLQKYLHQNNEIMKQLSQQSCNHCPFKVLWQIRNILIRIRTPPCWSGSKYYLVRNRVSDPDPHRSALKKSAVHKRLERRRRSEGGEVMDERGGMREGDEGVRVRDEEGEVREQG